MTKNYHQHNLQLRVIQHSKDTSNVSKTCRYLGISRETYYVWLKNYQTGGEKALINSKPCPQNPKLRVPAAIEEKIIYLTTNYYLGQVRISWY
ncbi:helix-turn-helix domain-containing protein [Chitinophaga silvisoli]|uniref:helix-turn-helix domain-containing protein n=1 Tax=Chitinophaga silvisoli TaxID=2291814 RepID=UPI0018F2229C